MIGGLLLAAVTSLPNAVAGIYLASQGRGAATLSVAAEQQHVNVVAGLFLLAAIMGFDAASDGAALTELVWRADGPGPGLAFAGRAWTGARGSRSSLAYLAFVVVLAAT